MAQKKITDLQLRDEVEATLNFPSDDTIQSYRVTASQIKDYILGDGNVPRTALAVGAVGRRNTASKTSAYTTDITNDVIFNDMTSGAYTATLHDATTCAGQIIHFVKTSTDNNALTIGSVTTLNLLGDWAQIISNGTAWVLFARSRSTQEVSYVGRAGFGSTNTYIPYFTSVDENSVRGDTLLTISNSSTLGFSVTGAKPCIVTGFFMAKYTGTGEIFGFSKNGNNLAGGVAGNTTSLVKGFADEGGRGDIVGCRTVLRTTDVLRPHVNVVSNLGSAGDWRLYLFAESI